jgi:methyl-accepting chemotaxis protein
VIIAIVFAILIGIIISRGITQPLSNGVAFAESLAAGNLNATLDVDQKDEVGILGKASAYGRQTPRSRNHCYGWCRQHIIGKHAN